MNGRAQIAWPFCGNHGSATLHLHVYGIFPCSPLKSFFVILVTESNMQAEEISGLVCWTSQAIKGLLNKSPARMDQEKEGELLSTQFAV